MLCRLHHPPVHTYYAFHTTIGQHNKHWTAQQASLLLLNTANGRRAQTFAMNAAHLGSHIFCHRLRVLRHHRGAGLDDLGGVVRGLLQMRGHLHTEDGHGVVHHDSDPPRSGVLLLQGSTDAASPWEAATRQCVMWCVWVSDGRSDLAIAGSAVPVVQPGATAWRHASRRPRPAPPPEPTDCAAQYQIGIADRTHTTTTRQTKAHLLQAASWSRDCYRACD